MKKNNWRTIIIGGVIITAVMAMALFAMGRLPICECGRVDLWHGDPNSSENSQHLTDPYTFTHLLHGLVFYLILRLIMPKARFSTRLLLAVLIETGWEVLENTSWTIDRYREDTISLGYYGDSIINSISDVLAMVLAFIAAYRWPTWLSLVLALVIEVGLLIAIRDNLTINLIMLIHPIEALKNWQLGL